MYRSNCSAPSGLVGPQPVSGPIKEERGGMRSGERQRPNLGELQWPVPLAVAFELTEAKLQDGLGARKSPGSIVVMAGEQRASKEIARNGLGDLEYCGEEDGAKYVIRGSKSGYQSSYLCNYSRASSHVHLEA